MASTAASSSSKLVRSVYRALLRTASNIDRQPAAVRSGVLQQLQPVSPVPVASDARTTVRRAFRSSAVPSIDVALAMLPQVNHCLAALAAPPAAPLLSSSGAPLPHGTLIRHKRLGYRGIVVGHDEQCLAGQQWVRDAGVLRTEHGVAQRFYHVLVDVRDRPAVQVSYVAADLAEQATGGDGIVLHPMMEAYFGQGHGAKRFGY